MIDHKNLGKGAFPDPPDKRDIFAAPHLAAVAVNWNMPFQLPDPGNEDQGGSSSCVAQSTSYYHTQIHPANYSRRNLYCRIFLPGTGGAYLRDGMKAVTTAGQQTRDSMPDPTPETEAAMRSKTGLDPSLEAPYKELSYASVTNNIDSLAAAVYGFKGAIFGLYGSDPGWQLATNPRPPHAGETKWGHALYAYGYHLHNGVKCIIAKSSWCNSGVLEHHIKQDYFSSGNTFSAWTLIPKDTQMQPQIITQKKGQELRVVFRASSQAEYEAICHVFGKDPNVVDETI